MRVGEDARHQQIVDPDLHCNCAKIVKHVFGQAGPQARMPRCTDAMCVATGKHI